MRLKLFLLTIVLSLPFLSDAQQWKRYRWEVLYGIGATNFLGELGGANQIGTDYAKDLELVMTRPALTGGMRFKLNPQNAIKVNLTWGMIAGDDALTKEPIRNARSLNFRSHLIELGANYEFYLRKEKRGHKFKLRGVRGLRNFGMYPYGFFGVSGFWFSPQGKVAGNWEWLHPLGTEGQGVSPTRPNQYSRFQIAIPYGLGLKYSINRRWLFGVEYGIRKTFTDYMDDVSTTYFPNDQILNAKGTTAALAADPTQGEWIGSAAYQQRGDPTDNDSYMFLTFTMNYKLKTTRRGLPKFR